MTPEHVEVKIILSDKIERPGLIVYYLVEPLMSIHDRETSRS